MKFWIERPNPPDTYVHTTMYRMGQLDAFYFNSSPPPPTPFSDDIFNYIFVNENDRIPIQVSLKYVPNSPIDNNPALVQVMA